MKKIVSKKFIVVWFLPCLLLFALNNSANSENSTVRKSARHMHSDECRLRVLTVGGVLIRGGINNGVTNDTLNFPLTLSDLGENLGWLFYLTNEDQTDFFLTCHHEETVGDAPYPYITAGKWGLSDHPVQPKNLFKDSPELTVAEFLGIPEFKGHYQLQNIGNLRVLAIKPEATQSAIVVELLNPDAELKMLLSMYPQELAYSLTTEEFEDILKTGRVTDSSVISLLKKHCQ